MRPVILVDMRREEILAAILIGYRAYKYIENHESH